MTFSDFRINSEKLVNNPYYFQKTGKSNSNNPTQKDYDQLQPTQEY